MACSHELAAAQQAAVTSASPMATALVPVAATAPPDIVYYREDDKDRRMSDIVARQWKAYQIATQRADPIRLHRVGC